MRSLLRYFVGHRTAANLLMALTFALGAVAATEIRSQFFPDVVVENATVRVTWAGVGPSDIDKGIVAILEPALRTIDGVSKTRALAREGVGSVVIEFEPGTDMDAAMADVDSAVDSVESDLPEGAEEPSVSRGRFRDRVTNVIISGALSRERLVTEAERLRDALFAAGVTRVTVRGALDPVIRIEPDPDALRRYGLSVTDLATRVRAEIEARPIGALDAGAARVRAGDDRRDLASLAGIAVVRSSDGSSVTLGQIARLTRIDGDGDGGGATALQTLGASGASVFFSGGLPAIRLSVERTADGDAIGIQRTVEEVVAERQQRAPEGVSIRLAQTRAQAIIDRLDILYRNGVGGLLIVLALLFLFLNARTAFWVAAGVPISILAAIGFMLMIGVSLNMLSLFALILCLGIIVDDAIVVGEHADHLHRRGYTPEEAAAAAAERMAGPVISASLTTIIAFAGLAMIGGRFGNFVVDVPLTVIAVVTASLIECFVILPAHMRHALTASRKQSWIDAPSRAFNRGFEWFRETVFRKIMGWAVAFRYPLAAGAIGLLLTSVAIRVDGTVPWFFFNAPERGSITVNFAMSHGATREDTYEMLEELRRALDTVNARYAEEHGRAPLVDEVAQLGGVIGRGLAGAETKDADHLGGMEVELIDPDFRPYNANDFARDWRAEIKPTPRLETLALRGGRSGPGDDPIEIELSGAEDARELKTASLALQAALAALPGVSSLEDSMPYDKPELTVRLTARGEALGFSTDSVAAELRARLDGAEVASFPLGGRESKVELRLPDAERTLGFVYDAKLIAPNGGGEVALADIAEIEEEQGFATVARVNGLPIAAVNGDVADDAEIRAEVARAIGEDILPQIEARFGVVARQAGLAEQERDFLSDALKAFGLATLGIYLTLAWVFGSWKRPLAIILAIPFGFVGAIWGHYLHGVPLSMFSVLGLIGLAGIVINDSIVLVAAIDEHARSKSLKRAVIDGACDRLRAVLLTTLTTVGGLAPLLFETSRQAQFLKPTVISLAYGLGFGVVIVLLVTPALLLIGKDISASLTSARRMIKHMIKPRPALGGRAKPAAGSETI